jgi:RNA polymerase sigma-70 factor (ECF subfamily)
LQKCSHRFIAKKKSSLFIEITDDQDQQAYNIADTTPSAEDELITEQIFPDTQFIKN